MGRRARPRRDDTCRPAAARRRRQPHGDDPDTRRALRRIPAYDHVLIDGKPFRTLEIAHTAIVGGDDACYTIACASIIAKVTRDRIMCALAGRYPNYRWDRNVGYATLAHIAGMAAHGVTPHHRRSFIPVRQLSLDFSSGPQTDIDLAELTKLLSDAPPIHDGPLAL